MRHSQRALSRIRRTSTPRPPGADAVAQALAGRDVVRLQPSGAYAANLFGLSEHGDTSGDTWPLCVPTNREPREFWRDARRRDSEWMVSIIALASIYTVWSDGHRYKVGSSGWTIDEFVRLWIYSLIVGAWAWVTTWAGLQFLNPYRRLERAVRAIRGS